MPFLALPGSVGAEPSACKARAWLWCMGPVLTTEAGSSDAMLETAFAIDPSSGI